MKMIIGYIILTALCSLSFVTNAAFPGVEGNSEKPVLVSCSWLGEHLADPGIAVLHVSAIKREYMNGHIEGARYLWPGWLLISTEEQTLVPADTKQAILQVLTILQLSLPGMIR
jgi:hypothetical protein